MDVNHSEIWLKAIRETLAEDGQPPLSAEDELKVRADVEEMQTVREHRRWPSPESPQIHPATTALPSDVSARAR